MGCDRNWNRAFTGFGKSVAVSPVEKPETCGEFLTLLALRRPCVQKVAGSVFAPTGVRAMGRFAMWVNKSLIAALLLAGLWAGAAQAEPAGPDALGASQRVIGSAARRKSA